jgi:NAD(P)-dependent dehydrogenase (short-subunit alcohol dehydrogenase family)
MSKSVLVTGCSSGFGLETAVALSRRDWRVFAALRDPSRRGDLDAALAAANAPAGAVTVVRMDMADPKSIAIGAEQVLEAAGGTLDALVNNAGLTVGGYLEDLSIEDYRKSFEVNFFGLVELTRLMVGPMREHGGGRIVVVSSNIVNIPMPVLAPYAASKWALEGWAEVSAMELTPFGIDLLVVQPGAHRTALGNNTQLTMPADSLYADRMGTIFAGLGQIGSEAGPPERVGVHIANLLEARRPAFRTQVGNDAKRAAERKSTTPYTVREREVRKLTGLSAPDRVNSST